MPGRRSQIVIARGSNRVLTRWRRSQIMPCGEHQPGDRAGDQRGSGRLRAGYDGSGSAGRTCGDQPEREPPRPSAADPPGEAPGCARGGTARWRPRHGAPARRPCGRGAQVSEDLAAAESGAQRGIGGGRRREALRIAAVRPVGVGGSGDPAPGCADLIVGHLDPGVQTERREWPGQPVADPGARSCWPAKQG